MSNAGDILNRPLPMDVWEEVYQDELEIEAAESGQDRELGFDYDRFVERRYGQYVKEFQSARSESK